MVRGKAAPCRTVVRRRPPGRPGGRKRDSHRSARSVASAADHDWSHSSIGQSARLSTGRLRVRAPLVPLCKSTRAEDAEDCSALRAARCALPFSASPRDRLMHVVTRSSVDRAPDASPHPRLPNGGPTREAYRSWIGRSRVRVPPGPLSRVTVFGAYGPWPRAAGRRSSTRARPRHGRPLPDDGRRPWA
jgi:hypothetical protein